MKHLSHPHDLKLTPAPEDNKTLECFGCKLPIMGSCYTCSHCCNFFLHKFCFELPQSAQFHITHYQHTLRLLYPPYIQSKTCDACGEPCNGFIYNCTPCNYNVHANCANLMDPNDPENDHDMYMTLFFAQKMGVISSLRDELRSMRAKKLEKNDKKPEKNDDGEEELTDFIRKLKMENELSRRRQNLYMQKMKESEDAIDFLGQIDSSSKTKYTYRYY